MMTMYEMIMDLPLFKGVSKDYVSSFLEKTNVNFLNFEAGEKVVSKGEEVKFIRFVISGNVRIVHALEEGGIRVEEMCGYGRVLGADRLYGMHTDYACNVYAATRTSIMEFSKDQYLRLLNTDHIYLLNFFNFLSRRAQRPVEALEKYTGCDIHSRISLLLSILTDPESQKIEVFSDIAGLAAYSSASAEDLENWLGLMKSKGIADYEGGVLRIRSRAEFLA